MGRNHRHLQDGDRSFCHTVGCSHKTFIIALFNYRIFSYKKKNTWWAWQVAYHHHTAQGIGWYSACVSSVTVGGLLFPFILINLGKSNSLYSTHQTGSWGFKRSCLWPMEKCLSLSYQLPGALWRNIHLQSHFRDLTRTY